MSMFKANCEDDPTMMPHLQNIGHLKAVPNGDNPQSQCHLASSQFSVWTNSVDKTAKAAKAHATHLRSYFLPSFDGSHLCDFGCEVSTECLAPKQKNSLSSENLAQNHQTAFLLHELQGLQHPPGSPNHRRCIRTAWKTLEISRTKLLGQKQAKETLRGCTSTLKESAYIVPISPYTKALDFFSASILLGSVMLTPVKRGSAI